MLPLRWAVRQPEPLKNFRFGEDMTAASRPSPPRLQSCKLPQLALLLNLRRGADDRTHPYTQPLSKTTRITRRHRRAAPRAPPPRTRPARDKTAGASWVLTSLIREASLGVGLGVVFGAVWSTMQTGPVSKRIVEYYKNNPTQS